MRKSIFEYREYKRFLGDFIDAQPSGGRGVRRKLAEAAGCQPAYVSHVLGGNYDFSPEQAEAIGRFLGLSRDEAEYFVLLVSHARAGTHQLQQFLGKMLDAKTEQYLALRNRVRISETLSRDDQARYYSRWYYSAIHMLLTIPAYRTPEKIASYLALPIAAVREALEFLRSRQLVELERGQFKPLRSLLHLENESPLIAQHHTNWRLRAVSSLAVARESDMHYSSCFSVSAEDARKLRSMMAQFLESATEVIKPSKEEKLYALCLDLFEA